MTIIPLIRHVATKLNQGGSHKERSRGWLAVPPDPQELKRKGPGIARKLKGLAVAHIVSSDLPRAADTAKFIAKLMNVPAQSSRPLRTWNTGDMAGKLEADTLPLRKKYIEYPDEVPPGGESFNEFVSRFGPQLKRWQRYNEDHLQAPAAMVVHGHHLVALESALEGSEPDPAKLDALDCDAPPGSVVLLHISPHTSLRLEKI